MRTAESNQQLCCRRFERLSDSAKQGKTPWLRNPCHWAAYPARVPTSPPSSPELMDFKSRRVSSFRKNLIELAELELKHAKVSPPASVPSCCPSAIHSQTSRFLPNACKYVSRGRWTLSSPS